MCISFFFLPVDIFYRIIKDDVDYCKFSKYNLTYEADFNMISTNRRRVKM